MAASCGTMSNFTFGNDRYQYYETIAGGSGAGVLSAGADDAPQGFDGTDVVQTHMTNSRLTDPEVLEWRFPVLLESFRNPARQRRRGALAGGRRRDSMRAFPGAHDGGDSLGAPPHRALRHGGRCFRETWTQLGAPRRRQRDRAGRLRPDRGASRRHFRHRNARGRRIWDPGRGRLAYNRRRVTRRAAAPPSSDSNTQRACTADRFSPRPARA